MRFVALCRYRWLSIVRAKGRTLFVVGFTLFSVLSMVLLGYAIERNALEIDRIYLETVILGNIQPDPYAESTAQSEMGNIIRHTLVERLSESQYISYVYYEMGTNHAWLIRHGEDMFVRDDEGRVLHYRERNWIVAPACLDIFMQNNQANVLDDYDPRSLRNTWVGEFSITFGDGFGINDFNGFTTGAPVPLIIHEQLLEESGFSVGNELQLVSTGRTDAIIIGTYMGGTHSSIARFERGMVLLPPAGLQLVRGNIFHLMIRFHIDPHFNREVDFVREQLNRIFLAPDVGAVDVIMTIDSDVIRYVIVPLELNLQLLNLFYPVVLVVAAVLAVGFPVLLLLQNTKNAAIVRSLGASRTHTRLAFFGEYMTLCIMGGVLCLIIIIVFGLGVGGIVVPLGVYFAATFVGATAGVVIITYPSPLELLQVRE
jgi:hypothetical protein